MQPPSQQISICSNCGGVLEETPGGGLGCLSCLLRAAIGSEEEVAQDSTQDALGGSTRFGVYEIDCHADGSLCELGRGAMGVTYRATDTSLQRKVALKIIKTDLAARSADARERFMREARSAAALRHENIATVHQFGMRLETGQYFYAMELIEGETLEERVRRAGPLDGRTTIEIAQQVTSALAAEEKCGLVHRDLKPANLMLVSTGGETADVTNNKKLLVKIIDFGLAKAIHTQTDPKSLTHDRFVGTPAFASPEQFEHAALDVRSDIYSLGETLWFALTGKTPFAGHSVEEIHRAQQSNALHIEQLKAAHVPHRLRSLLESMLAFEPASRPGIGELAARLQRCSPEARTARRTRVTLAAAALLILGASAAIIFLSVRTQNSISNLGAPEKSIAVLPFENRSEDKANAYFADGIQDEILTRLSKIADLKVISRTSTQQYQSKPANLREIAKQLGVATILEGSVQKLADQVRVNVQLIHAQSDSHLWADTYDRKLTDIFGVETEIAKRIAESLQAKLTGREEQALAVKPTNNPRAYDAYLRGLSLEHNEYSNGVYLQAATDYAEAVRLDPKFALAWARLAVIRGYLYFNRAEANTNTAEALKEAADRAMALAPDAGESWMAQGAYLYRVQRDFAAALAAFQKAQRRLPNDMRVYAYMAHIQRRLGRWQDAEANYKKAIELDPRSVPLLSVIGSDFYNYLRRFDDALAILNRTLEIAPDSNSLRANKVIVLQEAGRLSEAAQELARIPVTSTEDEVVWVQIVQGLYERQYDAAIQIAERRVNATVTGQPLDSIAIFALVNAGYCYAWTKRPDEARRAFRRVISELKPTADSVVSADGNGSPMLLAQAYAGLGEKENALKQAQQALKDYETDAIEKPRAEIVLAEIQAQLGDRDTAIAALPHLLEVPAGLTRADLKFNPFWDPLRGDPAFQKLCEDKLDKRIAVLPFENLSDPHDEYFSDGLSEELISALAQISELKVIGRSSSFRFKDRKEEPKTIGEKLGVSTLLEGTVRKQGDRVRIVAALTNAADGIELWTRTFDRELKDIFAVQEEIAKAVAESLKVRLLGSDDKSAQRAAPNSTEAHNAYLQGHFYFQRRNFEDYRKAVTYFDKAIRLDPDYALAYAKRSESWFFIGDLTGERTTAWPKAQSDAKKAVAIAPDLAEAHAALGFVRFLVDWKFTEGLNELKRAIGLSPSNPTTHDVLARLIVYLGLSDDAEREARQVVELDPLSVTAQNNLARVLFYAGKLDEADAAARKSAELQPAAASTHRWQVFIALQRGDAATALREAQLEPDEAYRRFLLALAQYVRGDRQEADAALADLIANGRDQLAYQIAEVYAVRGEKDKAFEWLQISFDDHDSGTLSLLVDPLLRGLRGDSRYKVMLEKVGLPVSL